MIHSCSLRSVLTLSTAAAHPYLGGSKSIPDKCHLIIVPGTILSQWASEIAIFLNPKAFDLFIYKSGQDFRDDFWSESGSFTRSNQHAANKIILATHSVSYRHFCSVWRLIARLGTLTRLSTSLSAPKGVLKGITMDETETRHIVRLYRAEDPLWARFPIGYNR